MLVEQYSLKQNSIFRQYVNIYNLFLHIYIYKTLIQ